MCFEGRFVLKITLLITHNSSIFQTLFSTKIAFVENLHVKWFFLKNALNWQSANS